MVQKFKITTCAFILCLFGLTHITVSLVEADDVDISSQHGTNLRIADLETQLFAQQREATSLGNRLSEANAETESLREQLTAANAETASLTEQLTAANAETASLTEQLTAANAESVTLRTSVTSANAHIATLQAQLSGPDSNAELANRRIVQLEGCMRSVSEQTGVIQTYLRRIGDEARERYNRAFAVDGRRTISWNMQSELRQGHIRQLHHLEQTLVQGLNDICRGQ